jgi:long-chain acyl-CoA synthetase
VVLMPRSTPPPTCSWPAHRATHTMLVPVQYQRLMALPEFGTGRPLVVPHEVLHQRAVFLRALKADVLARWPGGWSSTTA